MSKVQDSLYRGHRFPAEVIAHAVWLYFRFPLGLRMVEDLLAVRGTTITRVAHPPFRSRSSGAPNDPPDLPSRSAGRCQKYDPSALAQPVLRLGRTRQTREFGVLIFVQYDKGRSRNALHRILESRLTDQR
jgi:hypothetical protein